MSEKEKNLFSGGLTGLLKVLPKKLATEELREALEEVQAASVVLPKENKVKDEEVQAEAVAFKSHLQHVKEQYPELTLIQQRVLNYIRISTSPFPATANGMKVFLTPLTEDEITEAAQFLATHSQYKIKQGPYNDNRYIGYEVIKERDEPNG